MVDLDLEGLRGWTGGQAYSFTWRKGECQRELRGVPGFQPNSLRFREGLPARGGTEELESTTSKVQAPAEATSV